MQNKAGKEAPFSTQFGHISPWLPFFQAPFSRDLSYLSALFEAVQTSVKGILGLLSFATFSLSCFFAASAAGSFALAGTARMTFACLEKTGWDILPVASSAFGCSIGRRVSLFQSRQDLSSCARRHGHCQCRWSLLGSTCSWRLQKFEECPTIVHVI